MALLTEEAWQSFLEDHPEAHILQTAAWGTLKQDFGWTPFYVRQGDCGALVLLRQLPLGFTVAYVPRGPVGVDWTALWPAVDALCKVHRTVFLRVEPDCWEPLPEGFIGQHLPDFKPSRHTIQPPRTILIDLTQPEDDILMRMKSKTRYNIRLAGRKDVHIEKSEDVAQFHQMMLTTGARDAFGIHSLAYYQRGFSLFARDDRCRMLFAVYQGQPLAGLMVFAYGKTAWYFYGASTNEERNRMPTYLLQWEAMRWAKSRGCEVYDMWGVPDYSEEALEDQFLDRSEGLWGVYRFKRGFGGEVRRTIGAWDRVYHPALYRLYQLWAGRRREAAA